MPEPIRRFVLTPHASAVLRRRGLDESTVTRVLVAPELRRTLRLGRDVLQSRVKMSGRDYLVRVFVDVDRVPAVVVTAYRTSRIAKYWRAEP